MAVTGIVIAGAALSAYGQIQQGRAAQKAAEYNAAIDEQNAKLVDEQARYDERISRKESNRAMSKIRANYAFAGVTLDGSPLDVLQESAVNAEQDALLIRHKGEVNALAYRNSATLQRYQGKQEKNASYISAASTLLSSAGGTPYVENL